MIKKEIVFYLPEKYSFDKWVSLNKKIDSICRGYDITCRTVKEKKNRRQFVTIECPNEVAFLNAQIDVNRLMMENGLCERIISHRNINVREMIDMIEHA